MSASRDKQRRKQDFEENRDQIESAEKKQKLRSSAVKIIAVVLTAAVIGTIAFMLYINSTMFARNTTALVVGDEKLSIAEVNYYYKTAYNNMVESYGSYISMIGLDTSVALDKQDYPTEEGEEPMTWADYFRDSAVSSAKTVVLLAKSARDEGMELTQENADLVGSYVEQIDTYCEQNSLTVSQFMTEQFGRGVNKTVLRKILERQLLAQQYDEKIFGGIDISDAAVDKYYGENKNDFLKCDYRYYYMAVVTPDYGEDDDEALVDKLDAEALADAKVKAEEMVSRIKAEADFNTLAAEYTTDAEEKETYSGYANQTLKTATTITSSESDIRSWLSAAERKAGEKAAIEASDGYGYHVVYMVRPAYLDETLTVNVRHILISNDKAGDEPTDAEKAAAHDAAKKIYDQWLAGDATEDSFAALANEKSEDNNGEVTNGGLYEQVTAGAMVAEFNDWCYDPARKAGDTGIVDTTYGAHIMYFVGRDIAKWRLDAKNALQNDSYNKYLSDLNDSVQEKVIDFAISRVK